jgi:hypothetical protein
VIGLQYYFLGLFSVLIGMSKTGWVAVAQLGDSRQPGRRDGGGSDQQAGTVSVSERACDSFVPSIRCLLTDGSWLARSPKKRSFVNSATTCIRSAIRSASPLASCRISFATMQHPGLCFLGARGVASDLARRAFAALGDLYHEA